MKKNVGTIDRIVRIVLAILVAVLYFAHVISGTLGIVLLVIGGILLVTSLVSFCPLYWISKLSSAKKQEAGN